MSPVAEAEGEYRHRTVLERETLTEFVGGFASQWRLGTCGGFAFPADGPTRTRPVPETRFFTG
jgi:hypothetical protein